MRTLRKYTSFLIKIHSFALIFSFLSVHATPQFSNAFAQSPDSGIKIFSAPKDPVAIEGEYIIRFKNDQTINEIEKGNKPKWLKKMGEGTEVNTNLKAYNVATVRMANPASSGQWENLANILSSDPNIETVEPNYLMYASGGIPNDPMIEDMWFLNTISAPDAWQKVAQGREIVVAVIDSGIMFNHEDLRGRMWVNKKEIPDNDIDDDENGFIDDMVGWNFYNRNNMPYSHLNPKPTRKKIPGGGSFCAPHPSEKEFEIHGTHVAGTIAATIDNNKGIAGIAPNVKIMALKALGGACGSGGMDSINEAIIYAIANGADIINMSLGGFGKSEIQEFFLNLASDFGVLVVAAAGNEANDNDGRRRSYPASFNIDGLLSVAASKPNDQLAEFSNYGTRNVDLAAPGVRILSTIPVAEGKKAKSAYYFSNGTSMATPIVTGAAATVLSHRPTLTNLQIKSVLMRSTDKIDALSGKVASGGRLNMLRALNQEPTRFKPEKKEKKQARQRPQNDNMGGIRIFDNRSSQQQKW